MAERTPDNFLEPITSAIEGMKRLSKIMEFIHDGALMRFNQKAFFKEKDPIKKRDYLIASRHYEKKFDEHLESLWPGRPTTQKQTSLYDKE